MSNRVVILGILAVFSVAGVTLLITRNPSPSQEQVITQQEKPDLQKELQQQGKSQAEIRETIDSRFKPQP